MHFDVPTNLFSIKFPITPTPLPLSRFNTEFFGIGLGQVLTPGFTSTLRKKTKLNSYHEVITLKCGYELIDFTLIQ